MASDHYHNHYWQRHHSKEGISGVLQTFCGTCGDKIYEVTIED